MNVDAVATEIAGRYAQASHPERTRQSEKLTQCQCVILGRLAFVALLHASCHRITQVCLALLASMFAGLQVQWDFGRGIDRNWSLAVFVDELLDVITIQQDLGLRQIADLAV